MQLFEKNIHIITHAKYILNMKKYFIVPLAAAGAAAVLGGCAKQVDYTNYISDKRTAVYYYENDDISIKIYQSEREAHFNADGIKGNVSPVTEIYVTFAANPSKVTVSVGQIGGEMNYHSVKNRYYLSAGTVENLGENAAVTLTCDEKSAEYTATNVLYEGVLSCEEALQCAIEHKKELFEGMTQNGIFDGEIFVRLLYDEGCFYYVGVCGKDKKITAWLLDGERGRIIAERTTEANM